MCFLPYLVGFCNNTNNGSPSSLQLCLASNKNNKFAPLSFQMQTELNLSRKQRESTANNQSGNKTNRHHAAQGRVSCKSCSSVPELGARRSSEQHSHAWRWHQSEWHLAGRLPVLGNTTQVAAGVAQGYSARTAIFWWWHFIENGHRSRDSRKRDGVYIPSPPSDFCLLISKHLVKEISVIILAQRTTFLKVRNKKILNSPFLFYTHF